MTPMLLFQLFIAVITILMQHFVSPNNATGDQVCGTPNAIATRIVGGSESYSGQWPWLAAIFTSFSKNGPSIITSVVACGGAIISNLHILTAAHCFISDRTSKSKERKMIPANQVLVRLGESVIKFDTDPIINFYNDVSDVFVHHDFNFINLVNDIAILKLEKRIKYNDAIMPICLPTMQMANEKFTNLNVVVAGWGNFKEGVINKDLRLHHVMFPVVSNDVCQTVYPKYPVSKSTICAGNINGGKDACQGDSGGPLMIHIRNQWFAIGLVSRGYKCARPKKVGIYTRVSEFMPWIRNNMRK